MGDGDGVAVFGFLLAEALLAAAQAPQLLLGDLKTEHLFLQAAEVEPVAQLLVGAGLGAVALEFLATHQQLLLDDAAAFLALLHVLELGAGLVDAAVEEGNPGELIDQAAAILGPHRDNPGDIPLHHHVAALGIDPQAAQLGLQLLQVAGHAIGAVGAAVGAARGHPQPPGHAPVALALADPGTLQGGLQPGLGFVGLPIAEVEAHGDDRLGGAPLLEHGAIDQIGQPFGPHAAAIGQAQTKEHPIEDVAFAGAIGSGDDREPFLQRDGDRTAEGLEMGELDLIDVNQQARAPSRPNLAEALTGARGLPKLGPTPCLRAAPWNWSPSTIPRRRLGPNSASASRACSPSS